MAMICPFQSVLRSVGHAARISQTNADKIAAGASWETDTQIMLDKLLGTA